MRRIAVLDAPSNLGLRPPTATSVPGCAKAPGALRDQGLLSKLGARDAGCLTPPRYDPGDWRPGDGVAHAAEIAAYSRALADRIGAIIDGGEFPVILGGDCSILIGAGIAMHRLGDAVGGRIGLVFVDGHSDFRHPGNASYVGAAAGEDLALVTGRGQADLAAIESRRPYFRDVDVVVLGIRAQDEYRLDLQAAGIVTRPVPALRAEGAARSAQWARDQLVDCAGYWVHIDVDVLDPAVMPAVDAPDPGGIAFPELELLLSGLVESPHCLGVEITVFDPDYDPDGRYAAEITSAVVGGLSPVRTTAPRPDLIAARRDLDNPAARGGPGRLVPVIPPIDPPAPEPATGTKDPAAATGQESAGVPAPAAGDTDWGASLPGTGADLGTPAVMLPITMISIEIQAPDPASGQVPGDGPDPDVPVAGGDLSADRAELAVAGATAATGGGTEPSRAGLSGSARSDADFMLAVALATGHAPLPPATAPAAEQVTNPAGQGEMPAGQGEMPAGAVPRQPIRQEIMDASGRGGSNGAAGEAPDDAGWPEIAGPDPGGVVADTRDIITSGTTEIAGSGATDDAALGGPGAASGDEDDPGSGSTPGTAEAEPLDEEAEPVAETGDEPHPEQVRTEPERAEVRLLSRPLGPAPLLDSEPLPATRPGMLRPRPPADGGFGPPPAAGPGRFPGFPSGAA